MYKMWFIVYRLKTLPIEGKDSNIMMIWETIVWGIVMMNS